MQSVNSRMCVVAIHIGSHLAIGLSASMCFVSTCVLSVSHLRFFFFFKYIYLRLYRAAKENIIVCITQERVCLCERAGRYTYSYTRTIRYEYTHRSNKLERYVLDAVDRTESVVCSLESRAVAGWLAGIVNEDPILLQFIESSARANNNRTKQHRIVRPEIAIALNNTCGACGMCGVPCSVACIGWSNGCVTCNKTFIEMCSRAHW